jgi:hypothetical protein
METAALSLGISLTLDQVDATLVAIAPCSVRPTILAAVGSGLDRCDHQPQNEDYTIRTRCLRPLASLDVPDRLASNSVASGGASGLLRRGL